MPDVYQFDDFRVFLKECFDEKVRAEGKYSQRRFAREAGFSNPGYYNDVLKGFKPLSANAVEKMAKVFGLRPNETEFLKLLTVYGQARTSESKDKAYKQILARRNRSRFTRLNPALSRYYQDYRYPLVRGAIEILEFDGNYADLAAFLDPPIPVAVAKSIVRELCEWGLVEQTKTGQYHTTRSIVEPPTNLMGMGRALNMEWLEYAREALNRLPREKRHVSTMVLNISDSLHSEIQEMIEKFRDEVFRKVEADVGPKQIQQLTLAYVPRSKVRG